MSAYERQYDAHVDARRNWLGVNQPEEYRALGNNVLAFRKKARHGLSEMSPMARRGYGNAVLEAIRGKQAMALRRAAVPIGRPNCASGTFEQDGKAILKAVAKQNAAKMLSPDKNFSQAEACRKYEEAMAEKHGSCEWREAA